MKPKLLPLIAALCVLCLFAGCTAGKSDDPPPVFSPAGTPEKPPASTEEPAKPDVVVGTLDSLLKNHGFFIAQYNPEVLLKTPEQVASIDVNGLHPYFCYNVLLIETEGFASEIEPPYLTSAEREALMNKTGGDPYLVVYEADEAQAGFDSVYGPDRVHVLAWPPQDDYFISENGYLVTEAGWGDDGYLWFYEIADTAIEGKYGIVTSYCLGYNYFTEAIIDSFTEDDILRPVTGEFNTFSDVLAATGKTRAELPTYDIIYYYDTDRWYLYGVLPTGSGYTLP